MNELLVGLLGAMLATNQIAAVTNVVARNTGIVIPVTDPNDPVEKAYQQLLESDDAAQAEVDRWIKENDASVAQGGASSLTLRARIEQRFEPVLKAYEDFLQRHPRHVRARLAYGSFLNDTGQEEQAVVQWDKARELDPKNPAAWNNLANYYSHRGPVTNAFVYYAKAIELSPNEPVYYQNFATLVFLFRVDAKQVYHLADDQQVFRRALDLYRKARELDPNNFALATDLAQTYYYLKPFPPPESSRLPAAEAQLLDEALAAWHDAEKLAHDDLEREGVYVHLARFCLNHGRFAEARQHLAALKNPNYDVLKKRLTRNLEEKEKAARGEPPQAAAETEKVPPPK